MEKTSTENWWGKPPRKPMEKPPRKTLCGEKPQEKGKVSQRGREGWEKFFLTGGKE